MTEPLQQSPSDLQIFKRWQKQMAKKEGKMKQGRREKSKGREKEYESIF